MNRARKIIRTTVFKLSMIYIAMFALFAGILVISVLASINAILGGHVERAIDREIQSLETHYRRGGMPRLVRAIDHRSRRPDASLYLITTLQGQFVAGNIENVPAEIMEKADGSPRPLKYSRVKNIPGTDAERDHEPARREALVRVYTLSPGYKILVGRDMGERRRFRAVVRRAILISFGFMLVLGALSWLYASRRVLKRIDSVSATSAQIVNGDLSGRLEVTGSDDEFDRLANSLNDMLDRIEALMKGLKEVSDNIAHDLKTPLTRLRNRVEGALARNEDDGPLRETLEATLDDADQLIRIFNALLMIARVEAGSATAEKSQINATQAVRDVLELYEPMVTDGGGELLTHLTEDVIILANRELLGQAVANLIDNALKYADPENGIPLDLFIGIKKTSDSLIILVADNGIGIAEQDLERVTERFARLDESRSKPGFGLGLSMVNAVARFHGGNLRLSDNAPGLRAEVSIPLLKGAGG